MEKRGNGANGGDIHRQLALTAGLHEPGKMRLEKLPHPAGDAQAFKDGHPVAESAVGERQRVARRERGAGPLPGGHPV